MARICCFAPVAEETTDPGARYRLLSTLDHGAYGTVYLAEDTLCSEGGRISLVAVKVIERMDVDLNVEREIINMNRASRHPHIISLREVYLTPTHLAIAMEYAKGGNLLDFLASRQQPLSEKAARRLFQQIIFAVDYCHRLGIAHRDIKLENTLLDARGLIKLCDFGVSKLDDACTLVRTKVGTPGYTAPEILRGQACYDGKQADVWSAGVVLYLMLFSRHPFLDEGDNHNGAYPRTCRRILAGEYAPFPRGHKVSAAALDLVRRMLVCNPVRRLSIADIMAHAWFAQDFPSKARNWNEQYLRSAAAPPHTEAELRAIFAKAIAA